MFRPQWNSPVNFQAENNPSIELMSHLVEFNIAGKTIGEILNSVCFIK